MSGKTSDPAWPVLVSIQGEYVCSALMNRKAFRKSTEAGSPWIVHPATGRVLPWPGEPEILFLIEGAGCFLLDLASGSSDEPYGSAPPPDADPDDRSEMGNAAAGSVPVSGILENLSALIAERRAAMPEGSYTTHLFEAGLDKIRKKVGEEAIELLLAGDGKDVVYESADLVYHILVLLEASDLKWSDVTEELARRHGG